MAQGKVKKWNGTTGFLVDESDNADVFFGDRSLRGITAREIQPGLTVEFDRGQGPKGPKASNVRESGSPAPRKTASGNRDHSDRRENANVSRVPEFQSSAPTTWVLPVLACQTIDTVPLVERHPVIQLDRLSIPGKQEEQRTQLENVVQTFRDDTLLNELLERRSNHLRYLVACDRNACWAQTTAGPLTLHLSRSNVLENAGISLHSIYGFAYLPGTGLKGMARAAAVTLLKLSPDRVIEIFGNEPGEGEDGKQRAGSICFHDAWPVKWPKLFVDIVNNHHPKYYSGEDAPGDWESPNPVNFLAIAAGSEFSFHLTTSRRDTQADLLYDAASCLQAALCQSGAGAKTAAGYGWFLPPAENAFGSPSPSDSAHFSKFTLKLESPAFLAGVSRDQDDCDLRSATVRGQLRTWWRTLHSGFLTTDELRQLEAAVWGDTTQGSAIRFHLVNKKKPHVQWHRHPQNQLGLKYLAYGMDDRGTPRCVADPGGEWELEVQFLDSHYHVSSKRKSEDRQKAVPIPGDMIREQFHAALWLLTQYGGVGSKGRKGFGSLAVAEKLPIESIDTVKESGKRLRDLIRPGASFSNALAESPALLHPNTIIKEYTVSARSAAEAIDMAGRAYAKTAGANGFKHNPDKVSLGLPRKIHGPRDDRAMPHQDPDKWKEPLYLDTKKRTQKKPADARYSSPVQIHVAQLDTGKWAVRIVAMPAPYLPDNATSARFLKKFTDSFGEVIAAPIAVPAPGGGGGRATRPPQPAPSIQGYERVQVRVLEIREVNNKSQLKVQEIGREKTGMLIDGTPPAELPNIGDTITAYRSTTSNPSSPRYRWNLPEPPKQDSSKPKWKK